MELLEKITELSAVNGGVGGGVTGSGVARVDHKVACGWFRCGGVGLQKAEDRRWGAEGQAWVG